MEYANNQWHCRLEVCFALFAVCSSPSIKFDSVDIISKLVEFNFVIVRNGECVPISQRPSVPLAASRLRTITSNATAEFESIPPRQLYVSYYRMGVNAQWNKSPEIDPKYLETQAQRKKDWLAQAEKLRALREADPDKNAPVANKVRYPALTFAAVLSHSVACDPRGGRQAARAETTGRRLGDDLWREAHQGAVAVHGRRGSGGASAAAVPRPHQPQLRRSQKGAPSIDLCA